MARIHRRSAGTYEVVLESGHDPKTGRRLRQTFTVKGTKRDAEREAAGRSAALARGTYVDPSWETTGEFLHRWLRDYVDVSISLRSRLRYRDIVEGVLVPHLGGVPIQQLKPAHILAMEQEVRTTGNRKTGAALAPASVLKIHNVLHRALRHAVAWQVIPLNPADAVDRPSVPATPPRVLSPAEARWAWDSTSRPCAQSMSAHRSPRSSLSRRPQSIAVRIGRPGQEAERQTSATARCFAFLTTGRRETDSASLRRSMPDL